MEYPGSTFTKPWRMALLAVFIVIFVILTPTIILYSAGYRWSFIQNRWQLVGGLSIDTEPKNVEVYLNGKMVGTKSPLRLMTLVPDTYELTLSAPGYYALSTFVGVSSQETTYVKNISLIKKDPFTLYLPFPIKNLSVSPDEKVFIATYATATGTAVAVFSPEEANSTPTPRGTLTPGDYTISWLDGGNEAIFASTSSPVMHIFNRARNTVKKYEIPFGSERIQADPAAPFVYFFFNDHATRFSLRSESYDSVQLDTTTTWYVANDVWYGLRTDLAFGGLEVVRGTVRNGILDEEPLRGDGFDRLRSWMKGSDWQIVSVREGTLELFSAARNERAIVTRDELVSAEGGKSHYSPTLNRWYFIDTYALRDFTPQQDITPRLLYRGATAFSHALPIFASDIFALQRDNMVVVRFTERNVEQILATDMHCTRLLAHLPERKLWCAGTHRGTDGLWVKNY